MDEILYNALSGYYSALSKLGYYRYKDVFRLLLLCFYRDLIFHDFRGNISREDYREIEKALNCLFGTNCLIPYPDYLKMGKLYIGEITEIACKLRTLEDTEVIKPIHDENLFEGSDVIIIEEGQTLDD